MKISVVIPLYNEEENVVDCYHETRLVLERMLRQGISDYELIFVDDGSRDQSVARLLEVSEGDSHLRLIQFRRNFGQTAAIAAGLEYASGDIVVMMDGDLQNDPKDIPHLLTKLNEGYDLVAGWRKNRKDAFISRKLPSWIANKIISLSTNVRLHDYGCTLKMMTGDIARSIRLYGEMHRFIPALADEVGAKIAEIPVNHRPRTRGVSKYGISRTVRVILDLITVKFLLGYSKRPIHLFGSLGLISGGAGFALLSILTYQRFFQHQPMGNRPLLSLGVMLIIIGLQFIVFGLLAEILARTYYESQDKPIYVVKRIVGHQSSLEESQQKEFGVVRRGAWRGRVVG